MSNVFTALRRRMQMAIIDYDPELKRCVQALHQTTFFADINDRLFPYMVQTAQTRTAFRADADTILELRVRQSLASKLSPQAIADMTYDYVIVRHPINNTNAHQNLTGRLQSDFLLDSSITDTDDLRILAAQVNAWAARAVEPDFEGEILGHRIQEELARFYASPADVNAVTTPLDTSI